MDIAINILTILVLIGLLIKAADYVSEAFVYVAKRAKVSEFLVGFVILAGVTSLPELSVGLNSVANGVPQLAIGNLLGGSFVLISLIIGLNAVVHDGIPFHGKFRSHELLLTLGVIMLPVLLLFDQNLTPGEGLVLIGAYGSLVLHMRQVFQKRRPGRPAKHKQEKISDTASLVIKSTVGIAGLIFLSDLIVDVSIGTAQMIEGLDVAMIGIFILSIGTNLPEIAILLRSRDIEKERFAVGNFLGSATFNIAVIGLVGLFGNVQLTHFHQLIPLFILIMLAIGIFFYFERTRERITRQEGVLLIATYFSMILVEIIVFITSGQ